MREEEAQEKGLSWLNRVAVRLSELLVLSPSLTSPNLFLFLVADTRLHLAVSVGPSVCRSVGPSVHHIFEFRVVFALLLLPNCPRLDCRVSSLVSVRLYESRVQVQKQIKFVLSQVQVSCVMCKRFLCHVFKLVVSCAKNCCVMCSCLLCHMFKIDDTPFLFQSDCCHDIPMS